MKPLPLFNPAAYTDRPTARFYQQPHPEGLTVLQAAQRRFGWLWNNYRTVVVSWSTGKDSTVAAALAADTAPPGRRPIVLYHDTELMPTDSQRLAERMAANPDIDLVWSTTPSTLRCQWLPDQKWVAWDPNREWHRPRPAQSVVWPDCDPARNHALHRARWLKTLPQPMIVVVAVRCQESRMRRMRLMLSDNNPPWVFRAGHCWPLYDWQLSDVWSYIRDRRLDYNRVYDLLSQAGVAANQQRLGMALNHPATPSTQALPETDPHLYDAILRVHPGFAGLLRYAADNRVTGTGRLPDPPDGVTWQERIHRIRYAHPDPRQRRFINNELRRLLDQHRRLAGSDPILARTPHPLSGVTWERLTRVVIRGEVHLGPSPGRVLPKLQSRHSNWAKYRAARRVEPRQ